MGTFAEDTLFSFVTCKYIQLPPAILTEQNNDKKPKLLQERNMWNQQSSNMNRVIPIVAKIVLTALHL